MHVGFNTLHLQYFLKIICSEPTDLPIPNKKYNISEVYYLGNIDGCNTSISCANYTDQPFFNITVFWDKPATSSPIINYRIAYGPLLDFNTDAIFKIPFTDQTILPVGIFFYFYFS